MENRLIHAAAQGMAHKINAYIGKEGLELQKLVLGTEMLIINVSKLFILYLTAALMGILVHTLILHAAYILIKRYSFGLHALNATVCTVVTCVMFAIIPWFLRGIGINNMIISAAFTFFIVCLYLYAPADTKARPLVGVALRVRLKRNAVLCGIVLMGVALAISDPYIKFLLTLGAAYQCVAILPLTYKLFKRSEKNYENYERS
ncbi:MAG: accessory gene regulator B family protein [Defluviitaleaceae bacterium]|nr:accessory gene regulator B family protein [Defluviitaleaceae bacterium]